MTSAAVTLPLRTVGVIFASGFAGSVLYSNSPTVLAVLGDVVRSAAARAANPSAPATSASPSASFEALADQVRALSAEVHRGAAPAGLAIFAQPAHAGPGLALTPVTLLGACGVVWLLYVFRGPLGSVVGMLGMLSRDAFWISRNTFAKTVENLHGQILRLDVGFKTFTETIVAQVNGVADRLDATAAEMGDALAKESKTTRADVARVGKDVETVSTAMDELKVQVDALAAGVDFSSRGIAHLCAVVNTIQPPGGAGGAWADLRSFVVDTGVGMVSDSAAQGLRRLSSRDAAFPALRRDQDSRSDSSVGLGSVVTRADLLQPQ